MTRDRDRRPDPDQIGAIVGEGFPQELGTRGDAAFGADNGATRTGRYFLRGGRLYLDFDPPDGRGRGADDAAP